MDNKQLIPQELYNQILTHMPIVCVDVCIIKNGKVFLAKRNNEPCKGEWYIPGGRVQKNEELIQTAKRKAKDETRLDCIISTKILNIETALYEIGINNIPTHNVNICYLAVPMYSEQVVQLNSENCKYDWFSKDCLNDMELHPYVYNSIKIALL